MPVNNRYTFRIPTGAQTATTVNLPIEMTFQTVDQAETIERQFVDVEKENAINPIIDYEKTRFIARDTNLNVPARSVVYNCYLWDSSNANPLLHNYFNFPPTNAPTYYGNIGFLDDDLKFRKNNLTKSFLRLDFYDSPIVTDQNLVSVIIIQPDIRLSDILPNSNVLPAMNKAVSFPLENPLNNNENFGEGFFIYHYKDEVDIAAPKDLYMRASFNNAKTGKRTNMMTEPFDIANPIQIDQLQGQLHTKYTLKRDNTGYYYELDTSQYNVDLTGGTYIIRLYEILVG